MERTLLVGDHLLVNKFLFGGRGAWYDKFLPYRAIRRGDIIVFRFPYQDHPHYVKRVIGLPGDRVKIVDQQVYVNEKLLSEPYVMHDPGAPYDIFADNFPPPNGHLLPHNLEPEWADQLRDFVRGDELVVPPDHYFVMGDNRDRSWDSRYWGFVDRNAIMGRPMVIYWSIEADSSDYAPSTSFWSRLLGVFDTLVHLPTRTRWNRMLRLAH
jgi:signal peptidase I